MKANKRLEMIDLHIAELKARKILLQKQAKEQAKKELGKLTLSLGKKVIELYGEITVDKLEQKLTQKLPQADKVEVEQLEKFSS